MKRTLLELAYHCGLLDLYHRVRNRRVLTVVALHRVLPESDSRWSTCDPLYTVSARFLEQCLLFLAARYNVVSLEQITNARRGAPLPPRPLLITFDDGWADNYEYALPVLRSLKLPAALFVAGDALDRHEAFFQERLIGAWRTRRISESTLRQLWAQVALPAEAPVAVNDEAAMRALIARLQALPPPDRQTLLDCVAAGAEPRRQMLSSEELRALRASGFAVGTHGKQHEALTSVTDVQSELLGSKQIVARALQVPPEQIGTMSFPFSKQDAQVVQRAREAGYELLFGGGLSLTPLSGPLPDLIARVGITAREMEDARGNLRPAALAAYLFRRPHQALQPG